MKKKLERKRFRIKDEDGNLIGDITAISLVSRPAIEKGFGLFNEDVPKRINFQVSNVERMEITGPIMTHSKDIIRYDNVNKEYYYCYFDVEDIRDYRDFYMENANTRQANLEHGDNFSNDFFLTESWIVENAECDKATAIGLKDVQAGDWYGTYKCKNFELWNEIKNSDLTGFSVELSLDYYSDAKLEKELSAIIDDSSLTKEQKKEKIKAIIYN